MGHYKEQSLAPTRDLPTENTQAYSNQQANNSSADILTPDWRNDELPDNKTDAAVWWFKFGFKVIPLNPATKKTARKWSFVDDLTEDKIVNYWSKHPDHDIGAIVDDSIFVLDADAKQSVSALHMLEKTYGIESNLTVETTKGLHHYYRRAPNTYAKTQGFNGKIHPEKIDIKTARSNEDGRSLIVLPPSTGKVITLNEADNTDDLVMVGQDFIDMIFQHNGKEPPREPDPLTQKANTSKAGKHEAAEILSYISPDVDYDDWLVVLMGLHERFAGGDRGLEIADNWSVDGSNYCGREELEDKWRSFEIGGGVTFNSACKMAKDAGADLSAIGKKYDENGDLLPTYDDLLAEAKQLDGESAPELINALAIKMGSLGAIEMQMVAKVINKNTGANVSDLRKIAKNEERAKKSAAITARRQPDSIAAMNAESFPDIVFNAETGMTKVLATIPNIETMLDNYGISTYYDVIKKKVFINAPMVSGSPDNIDNTSMTACVSLAKLNQLPSDQVPEYIFAIADTNQRNIVADWITEKPWDGIDRLTELYNTLTVKAGYPLEMRNTLVRHWLISAVAAALKPIGFKARGVLTLQGGQSIGKTSWLESLIPNLQLRKKVVKTDHLLDPSDKDSIMGAVSHWLVELGELDSTFKKDVARLKGFITADMDKLRRPYARLDSEYQRRTVFFASVNDSRFLVDDTGNTRFWTIAVESINFKHGIDMQQLWAQVKTIYDSGEQWWLTREDEGELEELNKGHRVMPAVREIIQGYFNFESTNHTLYTKMSASEVLKTIGYEKPTNAQTKEAGSALRELLGEPTKSKGLSKWNVPPNAFKDVFYQS